ncbi:hypothetical protein CISIN_1g0181872mg, partial [Citrus sinensis]
DVKILIVEMLQAANSHD